MSVRILYDEDEGYACLYCSTTMQSFGSVFYRDESVEDFLNWLKEDARKFTQRELSDKVDQWRKTIKD